MAAPGGEGGRKKGRDGLCSVQMHTKGGEDTKVFSQAHMYTRAYTAVTLSVRHTAHAPYLTKSDRVRHLAPLLPHAEAPHAPHGLGVAVGLLLLLLLPDEHVLRLPEAL